MLPPSPPCSLPCMSPTAWAITGCRPRASLRRASPGWVGRLADARHVATLTATKVAVLLSVVWLLDLRLSVLGIVAGLTVDASMVGRSAHDTRVAGPVTGKGEFYRLGAPRAGRDDNPHIGTGAYALDQSFHHLWLLVAALIITTV